MIFEGQAVIENFDYDTEYMLLYEKPDDSVSQQQIRYSLLMIAITDRDTDYVTKPIKPGGRYYGYLPYLKLFKLSDDFIGTDPGAFFGSAGNTG